MKTSTLRSLAGRRAHVVAGGPLFVGLALGLSACAMSTDAQETPAPNGADAVGSSPSTPSAANSGDPSSSVVAPPHVAASELTDPPHFGGPMTVMDDVPSFLKGLPESDQKVYKFAANIVEAFTGASGTLNTLINLGTMLGILESGPTLESIMQAEFEKLNAKVDALAAAVAGSDFLGSRRDLVFYLGQLRSHAETAHAWVKTNHTPFVPPADVDTTLRGYMYTMEDDSFFRRPAIDVVTDGDGEWKKVTSRRIASDGTTVWDPRVGLPAFLTALSYRLIFLAAIDPSFASKPVYQAELLEFRERLKTILATIDSNVACGTGLDRRSVTCFGNPLASSSTYRFDAECADLSTGITAKVSAVDPSPAYDSSCQVNDTGVNSPLLDMRFWGQPSQRDVFNRDYATRAPYADVVNNGIDDANAQLRIKLGLFEVRRTIDSLYAMVKNDNGPVVGGVIVSRFTNRCLAGEGGRSAPGSMVDIEACDSTKPSQRWSYDRLSGLVRNVGGGASPTCLDVYNGSTRRSTPVWLYWCTGSIAQQWSYDAESHLLRNALGRTLDIINGNPAPGTRVWTYDENWSAAQLWGYTPPWYIGF
jgi:hypothetical protein